MARAGRRTQPSRARRPTTPTAERRRRRPRDAAIADRRPPVDAASSGLSGEGYRVRNLRPRHRRRDVRGRRLGPARDRRRDRQGAADEPRRWASRSRVATATSNLMIGITAAASAIIYLHPRRDRPVRRRRRPRSASSSARRVGSRLGHRVDLRLLRCCSCVVLLYTAFQMLLRGARRDRLDASPTPAQRPRSALHRPAADRRHLRRGRRCWSSACVLMLANGHLAARRGGPPLDLATIVAALVGPRAGGVPVARPAGRHRRADRPGRRRRASATAVPRLADGRASRSGSSSVIAVGVVTALHRYGLSDGHRSSSSSRSWSS